MKRTTYPITSLLEAEVFILNFLADGCNSSDDAKAGINQMMKFMEKTHSIANLTVTLSIDLLIKTKLAFITTSKKGIKSINLTDNGFYNAIIQKGVER